jgi:quinoprotein glucose dehydrogenase
VAFDPETHIAYMPSQTNISPLGLLPPDAKISDMNFVQGSATTGVRMTLGSGGDAGADAPRPRQPPHPAPAAAAGGEGGGGLTVQGLPLVKPPYGRITAIDLDSGRSSGKSRTVRRPTTSRITRR